MVDRIEGLSREAAALPADNRDRASKASDMREFCGSISRLYPRAGNGSGAMVSWCYGRANWLSGRAADACPQLRSALAGFAAGQATGGVFAGRIGRYKAEAETMLQTPLCTTPPVAPTAKAIVSPTRTPVVREAPSARPAFTREQARIDAVLDLAESSMDRANTFPDKSAEQKEALGTMRALCKGVRDAADGVGPGATPLVQACIGFADILNGYTVPGCSGVRMAVAGLRAPAAVNGPFGERVARYRPIAERVLNSDQCRAR